MADQVSILPLQNNPSEMRVAVADIRHFLWDRTLADNPMEMDLDFSDEEINYARKHASEMINAIPPYVYFIRADGVAPHLQYGYKLAIIYHLLLSKLMQLQRKDIDYSAGNMTVDINKRRIEYLLKWVPFFKQEAEMIVKQQKVIINLDDAYASL
jgi:Trm5-related predicted tRNA methylase